MGVPRDDDRSQQTSDYKSFAGSGFSASIKDLASYYGEMHDLQMDAMGQARMEVTKLSPLIRQAFSTPAGDAGVLPEGLHVARLMQRRQSDFAHFMNDALDGVRNIGSAALVVAEMYDGADRESTAGIDDVSFAFSDPGARAPQGFRKVESWSEYEQRMAAQGGQLAMSMTGDDSTATSFSPAAGVRIYTYPDGSAKQVYTTTTAGGETRTETTIYGPANAGGYRGVLQTTTETSGSGSGGSRVQTTSTTRYDAGTGGGTRSTTSTVTGQDGTITVSNQTSTVDKDGKQTGTPTTSDPVTIKPGQHLSSQETQGPVEQAEDDLDTYGTNKYVRDYGRGY